jgi:hypothetical protein
MAEAIYVLCALTSVGCAALLHRQYARTGMRLLAWSSVCFAGLAVNNLIVLLDLVLFPHIDMSLLRSGVALLAVSALAVGLVWESR